MNLDTIIDRCRTPKPVTPRFRPFTKNDWMAYGGCESDAPLIYSGELIEVVVDGSAITAILDTADDHNGEVFARDFSSSATAEAVGRSLILNPSPDFAFVEALLGESHGTIWS